MMFNINRFINENITSRPNSMFALDIDANKDTLIKEIKGKSLLVIGGRFYWGFVYSCHTPF